MANRITVLCVEKRSAQGVEDVQELLMSHRHPIAGRLARREDGDVFDLAAVEADAALFLLAAALVADGEAPRFRPRTSKLPGARRLTSRLIKLAEEKEFRQRSLLEKDAISRESYDQIATELQALEADLLLIQARIAETELRAPFDGIIGLRLLSEGSYASPSTKIVRLVKTSPLKIEFSIPERYAGEVRPGFPIEFRIDGNNNVFKASVYAVDPKIDIITRTIVVRALYPNTKDELKPGRFASITMRLSQIDNTIAIPTEAVIPEMDGEKVFLYKSGKAFPVKVTTGLRTESLIQIQDGLHFGDTLLTSGILQLREDLPVVLDTVVKQ